MTIPLAPALLTGSSNLPGDFRRAALEASPYLVLLRVGFCLPRLLPDARCALTAPFHPYPPTLRTSRGLTPSSRGGMFSVPLVRRVAPPGNYPAHCPVEFGLSSPACTSQRSSPKHSTRRLHTAAVIRPTATADYLMAALARRPLRGSAGFSVARPGGLTLARRTGGEPSAGRTRLALYARRAARQPSGRRSEPASASEASAPRSRPYPSVSCEI